VTSRYFISQFWDQELFQLFLFRLTVFSWVCEYISSSTCQCSNQTTSAGPSNYLTGERRHIKDSCIRKQSLFQQRPSNQKQAVNVEWSHLTTPYKSARLNLLRYEMVICQTSPAGEAQRRSSVITSHMTKEDPFLLSNKRRNSIQEWETFFHCQLESNTYRQSDPRQHIPQEAALCRNTSDYKALGSLSPLKKIG
jgi:hypothetical protein